ncbi:putative bifunctional diguanylate cyclase/phosphodiesterase [Phenylobacterium aquaticum]|uniref:putative bifunctional diguanylate cyclase/phosphodiesterase n=1 Tax=Phenylobacterium aquaticum TaxID=1763816 RepID=UPI001F5CA819|nr:EAL domain-containing protein [Phenylobacterium aquaticum]
MLRAALSRLAMIRRLQTKLTVLYAGLFGLSLLLISMAVFSAISSQVERQVRGELVASGTVFDRVWSLRSDQLRQGAALLSRDFGFREAVATRDRATIVSAMENLRSRFRIDRAFIIGVDGSVTAADEGGLAPHAEALLSALYESDSPQGIFVLDGAPYQMVATPILSPDLIGWVVFAARLDSTELRGLERLSAIPLDAAVAHRDGGHWIAGTPAGRGRSDLDRFVTDALGARNAAPRTLGTAHGAAIALVKPLPTLTGKDGAALLLTYPLSRAYAPYRALFATIALTGVLGLILVILGSWSLARSLTRPISTLDEAARRLQRGEDGHVSIDSQDEIGRLAESFNLMATEIRERERRITHLALHDAETGLPNRLSLERAIDERREEGPLFVAVMGIERFAHVRGAIGYALAAQVVREVGERLAGLREEGAVARLSTAVVGLVFSAPDASAAEAMVGYLLSDLEQPLHVSGDAIDVSLSVGLARVEATGASATAIERATIALDQARGAKRKTAFFDAEAYGDPSSNLALMSGMLWAIRSGQIELYHQPKYDLRRRGVHAAEGLVRWRHPTRGMLRPDLFIPMAEETGHIRTLTDWVLRQAVEDQAALAREGHELDIAINISGRLLGDNDFADLVARTTPKAAGKLTFEITETAVIENPDLALQILDRFRDAGVSISIDDFGSGLSSLAYLKQIRGHELKIDKSLITDVSESQRDALIVRSTIDLAHSLGLKVTAEGVETANTFQLLAAMGCDSIQGYLIAKPQPLGELMDFLRVDPAERIAHG